METTPGVKLGDTTVGVSVAGETVAGTTAVDGHAGGAAAAGGRAPVAGDTSVDELDNAGATASEASEGVGVASRSP